MTAAEHKPDFELTKYTPFLALREKYEVSHVKFLEKMGRIITAPHCMM